MFHHLLGRINLRMILSSDCLRTCSGKSCYGKLTKMMLIISPTTKNFHRLAIDTKCVTYFNVCRVSPTARSVSTVSDIQWLRALFSPFVDLRRTTRFHCLSNRVDRIEIILMKIRVAIENAIWSTQQGEYSIKVSRRSRGLQGFMKLRRPRVAVNFPRNCHYGIESILESESVFWS